MSKRTRKTVLSVFTGAGGLDLGLECAGFRTVACIELDKNARKTLQKNRPAWNLLETLDAIEVAEKLRPKALGMKRGELSILAGGPPCQPFSKAAQWAERGRSGLADPRSKCLGAFLELAERFLPHVILIENVPGFVKGKTSVLESIEKALLGINRRQRTKYRLEHRILNAADFGVPQRRQRAILIARRDGQKVTWPSATHKKPIRVFDALWGVRLDATPQASGYWGGLLPSIPEGSNYLFHTEGASGQPLFGRRRWFWSFLLKLAQNEPAWTISASPGPATGPFHWDNRPLAIAELLRLQTFPESWIVEGTRVRQIKQIGNATPPLLAEVIGRALSSSVFGTRYARPLVLRIPRRRTEPTPTKVSRVARRYLKHLHSQVDHPGEGRGPGAAKRRKTVKSAIRRVA